MLCEVPIRKNEISGKIVATKEPTSSEKLIEQNRFFFKMTRQCRSFPLSFLFGNGGLDLVFPALVPYFSIESWLFNRDPYFMVYEIILITG